jgi:prolyl-tRNA synthetase
LFTLKNPDSPEIHGGFALCYFASEEDVAPLLQELKVTIRCLPLEFENEPPGKCFYTGKPAARRGLFAKAY